MKHFSFGLLLLISFSLMISSCKHTGIINYQQAADSISEKWVPDKREGICDIKIEKNKRNLFTIKGETNIPEAKEELLQKFRERGTQFIDSLRLLPDTSVTKPFGLVTYSVVSIRKDPDNAGELITQALLGTPVKLLKSKGEWELVQTPDKYLGWVTAYSVVPMDQKQMEEWKNSERVIFLKNQGTLYSDPSTKEALCDLVAGCILTRQSQSGNYSRVMLPDGRTGFIETGNVVPFNQWINTTTPTPDKLLETAVRFMGIPYLWGGTSAKGMDCSGFTKTTYFLNGVILARDASLQYLHGKPVDISQGFDSLMRGDLLFFGRMKNDKLRVTHVGMYIGNKEFIHDSERVRINSFDSTANNFNKRLLNILVGARRVIGYSGASGIVPVSKHPWYF
jgi:gamma-D-glutamyl-L-lysine dipeptidyl-peptidase